MKKHLIDITVYFRMPEKYLNSNITINLDNYELNNLELREDSNIYIC